MLLIVIVVFSFAATLGVRGWAFTHRSGFAGRRPGPFPLFAFVFLLASGLGDTICDDPGSGSVHFGTRLGSCAGPIQDVARG